MVGRLLLASCGKKVGLEFMWDVTDQKLCCCGDTLISRDLLVYIYICAKHQMDRSQVLMARHGYLGQQLLGSENRNTPWFTHGNAITSSFNLSQLWRTPASLDIFGKFGDCLLGTSL